MAPRTVSLSLLFFKSLSGFGVGIVGMIILLIFVGVGLGTVSEGAISGPFVTFSAIAMGFVTAFITNNLGIFFFGVLDPQKYPDIRKVVKNVIILNIVIFLFLLPAYFFTVLAGGKISQILMVAVLQLILSAQASMFVLELSATTNNRDNLLAIYGIVFSTLASIVVNLAIYNYLQSMSSVAELAVGGSGGKGPTGLLFAILPVSWFLFGAFTTAIEMIYHWIYQTWGVDFLNR